MELLRYLEHLKNKNNGANNSEVSAGARALPCQGRGREFESLNPHHKRLFSFWKAFFGILQIIKTLYNQRIRRAKRSKIALWRYNMTGMRVDRASWDETFMNIAHVIAKRSPDPSYQVGAVIVTPANTVAGVGYNGAPRGIEPETVPWHSEDKHFYVCHAEANAILNATQDLTDCRIYTVLFPCFECMKMIIQKGIIEVIYADDSKLQKSNKKFVWSAKLAQAAGIKLRQYPPKQVTP